MNEIIVPAITANEDTIKLSKVLIKKNEFCKKNKIICQFESSKTSFDFESKSEGYIFIFASVGDDVKIGDVIGLRSSKKISSKVIKSYLKNYDKKTESLKVTKKAEKVLKDLKIKPQEIKKSGVIRLEDVESYKNKKNYINSMTANDKEYEQLEKIMKSLNFENSSLQEIKKIKDSLSLAQKIYKRKWKRSIPAVDLIFDRWSSAEKEGYGEGTNISHLSYIIGDVKIGKNCYVGPFTILDGSAGLTIGDNTSIAAGVHIYSHDSVSRNLGGSKFELSLGSAKIGNNCFIGPNAVVAKGVNIGNHCFVGSNSVLTFSIKNFSAVSGNPAKLIGQVTIKDHAVFIEKKGKYK